MRSGQNKVFGMHAPRARPTAVGAFWLACVLSVPVFLGLSALELLWRWLV